MADPVRLRGIELRYALTLFPYQHGRCTVRELIDGLTWQGFEFSGRPSNALSDAMRWEVQIGRVYRRGRGLYGPASMPRSTEYRIHQRVVSLRERAKAARCRSEAGTCSGGSDRLAASNPPARRPPTPPSPAARP
jgi:hypothetical protein